MKKHKGEKPQAKTERKFMRAGLVYENIKRECLKCERTFFAENKFTRLCVNCKNLDVFQEEDDTRFAIIKRR
jgi:hypothetical protein